MIAGSAKIPGRACALLLLLMLMAFPGTLHGEDQSALWPVREKGKFGYIDRSGQAAIRPQFEEARHFQEDLAAVKINGLWGFINADGLMLAPPKFESVEPFADGAAAVKSGGKWGFIDNKGRVITPAQFDWAMSLREGMALVKASGKYGFVRRDGQIAIAPSFGEAGEFREGLARVKVRGLWGFTDRTGKMVIEPSLEYAGNFSEGLAQVEKNGKQGYIDKTGRMVIPPIFDVYRFGGFSGGLAMIVANNKFGYIDKNGKIALPPQYWLAWQFQEGAARVQLDDAKWVLISRSGEILTEGGYDSIDDFHEGRARVRIYRSYGYVDQNGKLTVPVEYSAALPFSEGLAAVYMGGSHRQLAIEDRARRFDPMSPLFLYSKLPFSGEKVPRMSGGKGWGYIDRLGKIVIPPGFTCAGSFRGGLAEVQKGDMKGYISKTGTIIWQTVEAVGEGP